MILCNFFLNTQSQLNFAPLDDGETVTFRNSSLGLLKTKHKPKKINTRPRRPGFKGHPIGFMIILEPYLGPLFGTPMDPFGPIKT